MSKYHKLLLLIIVLIIGAVVVIHQVPLRKGLDLEGGMRVVLQADKSDLVDERGRPLSAAQKTDKMDAVVKTLENRLGGVAGVVEPKVSRQGDDRVLVEIPGVKDEKTVLAMLQETAKLDFYFLRDVRTDKRPSGKWEMRPDFDPKTGQEVLYFTNVATGETIKSDTPEGQEAILYKVINAYDREKNPDGIKPFLTGDNLKPNAKGTFQGGAGSRAVISIEFDAEGAQKFARFTRTHVGDLTAIVLGGKIVTAPTINEPILNGQAVITGFATVEDAHQRAQLLNSGALPVGLTIAQLDDVEATLGKETVNKALTAGLVGLALVLAFMLFYYRLPGFISCLALIIYAVLTFAIYKSFSVTMTLPGVAGFILSIGMAVDANILIFERLKEELRSGKTLRAAIDAGFTRAFTAIFDSNMCTAISCIVLMKLGTGSVQSFAFTLLIGVAVSMFSAITVTRTFLHLLVSQEWAQKPSLFGLSRVGSSARHLNIVGRRNIFFAVSVLAIIPGVVFYFLNMQQTGHGLKPGIEFKPGTSIQMTFEQADIEARFAQPITASIPEVAKFALLQDTPQPIDGVVDIDGNTVKIRAALGRRDAEEVDAIRKELDKGLKAFGQISDWKVNYTSPTQPILASDIVDIVEGLGIASTAQISREKTPDKTTITTAFIRTGELKDVAEDTRKIVGALEAKYGEAKISTSSVGRTVSAELTRNAILAVIVASLLIMIYLTFRFAIGGVLNGIRYGVCTVVATLHDVLIIAGLFAILGYFLNWEIDTLFVTAILTMIGFSTHDTIVVFDRIRENLRHRLKGEDYDALANRSILQTLSRSINTSVTTLFPVLALIILGGATIKTFYIALAVGIISGTYSSIFNAAPLVVVWENISNRRKSATGQRRPIEEKPLVARERSKELKAVAESVPNANNGGGEPEVVVKPTSGSEGAKVKPKRKKRRY